jgi:hypothetical protein
MRIFARPRYPSGVGFQFGVSLRYPSMIGYGDCMFKIHLLGEKGNLSQIFVKRLKGSSSVVFQHGDLILREILHRENANLSLFLDVYLEEFSPFADGSGEHMLEIVSWGRRGTYRNFSTSMSRVIPCYGRPHRPHIQEYLLRKRGNLSQVFNVHREDLSPIVGYEDHMSNYFSWWRWGTYRSFLGSFRILVRHRDPMSSFCSPSGEGGIYRKFSARAFLLEDARLGFKLLVYRISWSMALAPEEHLRCWFVSVHDVDCL